MKALKHLSLLMLLFTIVIPSATSSGCKVNAQARNELVQDIRSLLDNYKGCQNACEACWTACGSPPDGTQESSIKVLHLTSPSGSYKLATWEDGYAECAKHGFTMATQVQLASAWRMGYDQCSCGWLADGSVKYPVIKARPGCGDTTTGVINCPTDPSQWNTEGWDVYCSTAEVPVIHHASPSGSSKLATWEDGWEECKKHGLTMATTSQLHAAWEAGYDMCSCGWLADGTVKYPVTNARPGCGDTSTGLMPCPSDPTDWNLNGWDVYCSRTPVQVVHLTSPSGGYKLATWEEGKAECEKHKMTMATTEQLQAAWEEGYDQCSCGWLRDGSVKYPVTNARSGCGDSSTGLISCPSDPSDWNTDGWDVYCFAD